MKVGEKKVGEMLVGEKKVGEILVGEMQVGEKTWSVKLKVGEILGHQRIHTFLQKVHANSKLYRFESHSIQARVLFVIDRSSNPDGYANSV